MSRRQPLARSSLKHWLFRVLRSSFLHRLALAAIFLGLLQALLKNSLKTRTSTTTPPGHPHLDIPRSRGPLMGAIRQRIPLGRPGPWRTQDPYLFCVHHNDEYPAGTSELGPPKELLRGRQMGSDFSGKDGWSMYHGSTVPGFPQHPHRGFETVTIMRNGFIDHSDSLGATARFGNGDTQWMTAGKGILHAEMGPLLNSNAPNPFELFQIWINLPAADKMVQPHFKMLWAEDIPSVSFGKDGSVLKGDAASQEEQVRVTIVAGDLHGHKPPPPPPHSWASKPEADVALLLGEMRPESTFYLPPARTAEAIRTLYVFDGAPVQVGAKGEELGPSSGGVLERNDEPLLLRTGDKSASWLLMQGKPIGEPVEQHGPFVMNTREEIQQAFLDYRKTQFGGWPWPTDDPNHGPTKGRFAIHADGKKEER